MTQALLSQIVGTTRSRVNLLMSKFRRLGLIEFSDGVWTIHDVLLTVVLRDD